MPLDSNASDAETPPTSSWVQFLLAAPVVTLVTVLFWQCVDLVRTEQLLSRAASAAAREATLPRATLETVSAAADRALIGTRLQDVVDRPIVSINNQPALLQPLELLQSGDRVEVTVGAYATEVVPDVLRPLGLSLAGRKLRAVSIVTKP